MAQTRHRPPSSRIPDFRTIEEEAAFWDSHSTTEFEDEWEPAELEVATPLMHSMKVSFDASTLGRIAAVARARGVQTSVLMQNWILAELDRAEATSRIPESPVPDGA